MAHRDTSVSGLCRKLGIRPVTLYRCVGPPGELREGAGPEGPRILKPEDRDAGRAKRRISPPPANNPSVERLREEAKPARSAGSKRASPSGFRTGFDATSSGSMPESA